MVRGKDGAMSDSCGFYSSSRVTFFFLFCNTTDTTSYWFNVVMQRGYCGKNVILCIVFYVSADQSELPCPSTTLKQPGVINVIADQCIKQIKRMYKCAHTSNVSSNIFTYKMENENCV